MTNRNQKSIEFQALNRKIIQGEYNTPQKLDQFSRKIKI